MVRSRFRFVRRSTYQTDVLRLRLAAGDSRLRTRSALRWAARALTQESMRLFGQFVVGLQLIR